MDVKITFLGGGFQKKIYINGPKGYLIKNKESLIYKFFKTSYRLKQCLKTWYKKRDEHFASKGSRKNHASCNISVLRKTIRFIIFLFYANDLITIN